MTLLALGAFFVGVSKLALPGLTTLSVVIFALVLPTKTSTAVLLILLIVGDLLAVKTWFPYVHWDALKKLFVGVLLGVLLGSWFLAKVPAHSLQKIIGTLILVLIAITFILQRSTSINAQQRLASPVTRYIYGTLAGFTTMTANAGGPVVTLYFLASGYGVEAFLGTQAWFFFLVNLVKLPLALNVGLLNAHYTFIALALSPLVIVGAICGRYLVRYIKSEVFNNLVTILTLTTALYLVIA